MQETDPQEQETRDEGEVAQDPEAVTGVGLAPKGKPMPQTIKEWMRLGELYEIALLSAKAENSKLRAEINGHKQRISMLRREHERQQRHKH